MRLLRFLVFVCVLSGGLRCSIAQTTKQLEAEAEDYFFSENFFEALDLYREILKTRSHSKQSEYRAEICSLLVEDREKSLQQFNAFRKGVARKDKFYNYWKGRIHYVRYQFEESAKAFKSFLTSGKSISKQLKEETGRYIKNAEMAKVFYNSRPKYLIERLPNTVNTKGIELSPAYLESSHSLIYMSSESFDQEFSVYSVDMNDKVFKPKKIDQLGSYPFLQASIEVVNNDGRLFVYNPVKNGDLFYSELKNGAWTELNEFDSHLEKAVLESHFFINEHENRIIYGSSKRSKYGDLNLYESRLPQKGADWTRPIELDKTINSDKDEESPYLTPDDKTLYFSSKGHGSIGGYDVFMSRYSESDGKWSEPEQLPYPINTIDNEMHFKLSVDGKSGYFVSDRVGVNGREFDIFHFFEAIKVKMEGTVSDQNNVPVDNVKIVLLPTRKSSGRVETTTIGAGNFNTFIVSNERYLAEISVNGKLEHKERIDVGDLAEGEVFRKNFRVRIEKDEERPKIREFEEKRPVKNEIATTVYNQVPQSQEKPKFKTGTLKQGDFASLEPEPYTPLEKLGNKFRPSGKAIIRNIYFNFDQIDFEESDRSQLDLLVQILMKQPDMQIEIAGHGDNIGTKEANLKVSEARAINVANYLIKNGIDKNRLIPRGYGESMPLASNDDEREGRELNRRIEVKILE